MGTYYPSQCDSRKSLIDYLTRPTENPNGTRIYPLRHCLRGNVLWSVWERIDNHNRVMDRWIRCDLMIPSRSGRVTIWGYKPMEESMHPFYYTCPLSYFELVPASRFPDSVNIEFRAITAESRRIRQEKARRKKLAKVG